MEDALLVKNKMCFIDGSYPRESVSVQYRFNWDRCNAIVNSWIVKYVSKDLASGLMYNTMAQLVWNDLKEMFNKVYGTRIFHLCHELYHS